MPRSYSWCFKLVQALHHYTTLREIPSSNFLIFLPNRCQVASHFFRTVKNSTPFTYLWWHTFIFCYKTGTHHFIAVRGLPRTFPSIQSTVRSSKQASEICKVDKVFFLLLLRTLKFKETECQLIIQLAWACQGFCPRLLVVSFLEVLI